MPPLSAPGLTLHTVEDDRARLVDKLMVLFYGPDSGSIGLFAFPLLRHVRAQTARDAAKHIGRCRQLDRPAGAAAPTEVVQHKAKVVGAVAAETIRPLEILGQDRKPDIADPAQVVADLLIERVTWAALMRIMSL